MVSCLMSVDLAPATVYSTCHAEQSEHHAPQHPLAKMSGYRHMVSVELELTSNGGQCGASEGRARPAAGCVRRIGMLEIEQSTTLVPTRKLARLLPHSAYPD